jgi:mannosyltransferase
MRDRTTYAVAAATVLAGVLRFATLDSQSFWHDEAVAVDIARESFFRMLLAVPARESTPPLYYALAWTWGHVFGTGEVGLRALSALLGTATVPVVYAVGRSLVSKRAGVVAAALAAVNPFLIWYSQEARAYALLAFLSGLSLLFAARAAHQGGVRSVSAWAIVASLAVATHYFAAFLVAAEAVWLYAARPVDHGLRRAFALVAAVSLIMLPLAGLQAHAGRTTWIADIGLGFRIKMLLVQFVAGRYSGDHLWLILVALVSLTIVVLLTLATDRERRGGLLALGLAGATVALPLAAAVAGVDYFFYRNLTPAWIPLTVGVAAALGAWRLRAIGLPVAAVLCAGSLAATIYVHRTEKLHRADWRAAASAMGQPRSSRVIVTWPDWEGVALGLYRPIEELENERPALAQELYVIGLGEPPASVRIPREFALVERREIQRLTVIRYEAQDAVSLEPSDLAGVEDADLAFFVETT